MGLIYSAVESGTSGVLIDCERSASFPRSLLREFDDGVQEMCKCVSGGISGFESK